MNKIYEALYNFRIDKRYWKTTGLTGNDHDVLRSKPGPYIKKEIEIAKLLGLKTVVEIGSCRFALSNKCLDYFYSSCNPYISPPCCNDGHASLFWALEGFDVHTVDIDVNCKRQVEWSFNNINKPLPTNLHIQIPMDGIQFLQEFQGKIDVLFLDGWDVGTPNYQQKHLDAFIASEDKLSDTHLVIIDDTDFDIPGEGKDALLSPYLINKDYTMLFNGRQTLFVKW